MIIRPEHPADIPAIRALVADAFCNAAHSSHTEHHIIDALRERGELALSLVAEENGQCNGHLAASPVALSDGSSGWYGLGPIAVAPERQRHGIGSALIRHALAQLRPHAAGCVLLGDPAYYQRFGFAPHPHLILPGFPHEYFMAIAFADVPLQPATVAYSPAFG